MEILKRLEVSFSHLSQNFDSLIESHSTQKICFFGLQSKNFRPALKIKYVDNSLTFNLSFANL